MAEENISVQQFSRVHLVPRLNQGQAIAIVFELPGVPPVAYGAPVQTLQQLFWRIPQVLLDAKKIRLESGIVDLDPPPSAVEALSWPADSIEPSIGLQGQIHLDVQMGACSVKLGLSGQQLKEFIKALTAIATHPDKAAREVHARSDKAQEKSVAVKQSKSEITKTNTKTNTKTKTQPVKTKVATKTVAKAKPANKLSK